MKNLSVNNVIDDDDNANRATAATLPSKDTHYEQRVHYLCSKLRTRATQTSFEMMKHTFFAQFQKGEIPM